MKTVVKSAIAACIFLPTSFSALAYEFPDNIPVRKPGLWEMRTTGTIGPNQIKAIKKLCLDAEADHALYELNILRKELTVVYSDIACQAPKIALSGNVMTGEMACRTNSTTDSETAGKDFRWTTTFNSDSDIVHEEHGIAHDVLLIGDNKTVEKQRWTGECPADMSAGDELDLGFVYNNEE